jgi:hypothetical protein
MEIDRRNKQHMATQAMFEQNRRAEEEGHLKERKYEVTLRGS